MLYDSLSQLQTVQERFIINVSTITLLRKSDPESEALVPLTPSVYVSCRTHPESVLIDIGTGYYLEMSDLDKADAYYVRRIKYIQEQLTMVSGVLAEKQKLLQCKFIFLWHLLLILNSLG